MKYFYDSEFLEDGSTVELISIAVVAEDGREYYAVNRDFSWLRIARRCWWAPWRWEVRHQWLADHVVPHLPKVHGDARLHASNGPLGLVDWQSPHMRSRERIAADVRAFLVPDLEEDNPTELWADYAAYDHVALCQLWGRMIDLPGGVPMWTHDFQQRLEEVERSTGQAVYLPDQAQGLHHALADARHLRDSFAAVDAVAGAR